MATTYPVETVYEMFSLRYPANREYAARSRRQNGERWLRPLTFASPTAMKVGLKNMGGVFRLEVGPVWTHLASRLSASAATTIAITTATEAAAGRVAYRELVFDLDIDAYDGTSRSCCSGATWCKKCWPIVGVGCAMIDAGLCAIGARSVGWFYSGRRGMHCWVMDPALASPDDKFRRDAWRRVAPVDAATVTSEAFDHGDPLSAQLVSLVVNIPQWRHGMSDAFLDWYRRCQPACARRALSEALRRAATARQRDPRTAELARRFDAELEQEETHVDTLRMRMARCVDPAADGVVRAVTEAALSCLLPRTDAAVTFQARHMLGAPFCVHEETKRVGVFVRREELLTFYPGDDAPVLLTGGVFSASIAESLSAFREWVKSNRSSSSSV